VVDRVIEIPLPGRTFCGAPRDDRSAPPQVAIGARLTLNVFVAGAENRLAATAINRLLDSRSLGASDTRSAINVLAIYGASGTGKTHLARGLVQSWQERGSNETNGADCAQYLPASDFRHMFLDAIKRDEVSDFRRRLRGYRLLAIDDVDRLPRDPNIQQELRYTIDALVEAGAMLVVTASTSINAARTLSVDVRSRLAEGLELRLAPPDEAARERIAHHVSAALGRPLSPVAARRLAEGAGSTAGDVFAALFELGENPQPVDDVHAVEMLLAGRAARQPAMRKILQAVAKYYRIPQKVLKSSSRRQSAVTARAMAVYLARELAGLSYERIGHALGGRDHTTIMHNYRKIADALRHDAATRGALAELERNLQLTC
jgi:chromosomal replication initiator protein